MKKYFNIQWIVILLVFSACEDYLDVKPAKDMVVPQTLRDYRALLDATNMGMNDAPTLQLVGTDDVITDENAWNSLFSMEEKNAFVWADEIMESSTNSEWVVIYTQVFYSNLVIEGLQEIEPENDIEEAEKDDIHGSALFYRAFAFFKLLNVFAAPYDEATAAELPGIPLRTSSNVNHHFPRADIKQCYEKIISDLEESLSLLPEKPLHNTRPSQGAVVSLLARVYLSMEDYENAGMYAQQALEYNSELMDYSQLDGTLSYPIPPHNSEIIFYNQLFTYGFFIFNNFKINPDLYQMYEDNDLRRSLFFSIDADGMALFRGSYTGSYRGYAGLTVDEMYLILAESLARTGNYEQGMDILNELLITRWVPGTFIPLTAADAPEALEIILRERRKELVFRGLRWSDLRRLNKHPETAVTQVRILDGVTYTLPPNDPRYTFLIPHDEITLGNLQQNPR